MTLTIPPKMKPPVAAGPNGAHPLADRLGGCWLLNEGAGQTVHDLSGRHHDGSFSGGPGWLPGAFGPAIEFDGNNDWINMGNCLDLGTDDITMLALVQYGPADQPEQWEGDHIGAVAGKGYLGASNGYGLSVSGGNRICWQVRNQGDLFSIASNSALNDGQWHTAVAVCDRDSATGLRLYIDGVRQSATADPTSIAAINITDPAPFAVGSRQDSYQVWAWDFLGRVAAIYVWKRVLTETEIGQLYREPFALFARRWTPARFAIPTGAVIDLAGTAHGVSSASAALQVIRSLSGVSTARATAVAVLRKANPATRQNERPWLREALLNGMTSNAFQLGTILTRGWFWVRRNGCAAVYRGRSITQVDLGRIVHVADLKSKEIPLPAYLSHPADSTHCYLVRRFNRCGRQERTTTGAVTVRIGPDGELTQPAPNAILALQGEQIGGLRLRLTWFYDPLDQRAAPRQFHVCWDGATGRVDWEHPLATILYKGRKLYQYETGPLEDGRYTFVIRPCSLNHVAGMSSGTVVCSVTRLSPEAATILGAEAV